MPSKKKGFLLIPHGIRGPCVPAFYVGLASPARILRETGHVLRANRKSILFLVRRVYHESCAPRVYRVYYRYR